ncbi:PREDICTED: receptor-like cytosolic serine/threonine-protein kinase RBK2 isoform X2 [Ipomoea nil]|uniref:receptor-like cytosolic serine/threonine-protein kinase RBK2 isoform X2 n=1 Tax=Ipomoea nil TaxID=35883 RepID=UPI000900CF1B|nr:PREDICTED: receptor-like cytosolic serine/threonine-protein kinase RBK2 isoform X2 [Ipomoea nil]
MGGKDDSGAEEKRRNVLVGIRFDGHTKELLDWALVKVADPGDRVLAIHVSTKSSSASDGPNTKDESYSSWLESYLDDYDGLCTKNQVHLKAQVLKGSSTRKMLVREAKKHDAVAVIVGTSNHKRPLIGRLGGWTSIAKYCAKQLPTSVDVMAIHNGRIVFRRGSNSQYTAAAGDPRPSFYTERSSTVGDSHSEFGESDMGRLSHETECYENYSQDYESLSSTSPKGTHKKGCLSLASISLPVVQLADTPPGWPLLRYEPPVPVPVHARKMSVVQWVMTLPNRSLIDLEGSSPKSSEEENCSFSDKNESCSELINEFKLLIETNSPACKWFSYSVLTTSTSQFSSENLIGKGGCNQVYKGVLPDGKQVAVKILKSSEKAWKDFMQEVDIMTSVKHKNIAPLLGICIEDTSDLVSVYNFLSQGNLEENLHGKGKGKSPLAWKVRLRIATGIAEALNYLHNEHPRPIIHRDVKSSNILLGDEFEAKLSDLGLAIWGPTRTSFATHSDVVGTFGYLAPEYFMYGKVSDKIDVYSFGVVLLELLSGRRAIGFESARGGQESLVMWAKPKLESGDLKGIIDENLNVNGDEAEVQRVGLAARLCLTQAARFRPNIAQILKMLRGEKDSSKGEEENENEDEKVEMDDEVYPDSSVESHLSLALMDSDANHYSSASFSSSSPYSVEEYLKKRWSRSSSLE